ncbi:MAG: semialdehyde dehydrogenase [Flavobacteriales bacterium]|nr:semialdehyde dehydrogenase [Flavobacteriales bacterium]|tara:strand:+ start:2984 stop:3628 length:645 start_codon:yes stop_codon:yes gene_type:complete
MQKLHALVLGATGATGRELVNCLLRNTSFIKVSVFVRGNVNISHKNLIVHKINFSRLHEYQELIYGDVLFSALGTTRKDAGSKEKQYLVDYTYQYEFAKIASINKVSLYSLVSSIGANKKSFLFYPSLKGTLEESVKNLNFNRVHIFQPPSLIRQKDLIRNIESISIWSLKIVNQMGLLRSFKPLLVRDLAKKMIHESLLYQSNRVTIYSAEDL